MFYKENSIVKFLSSNAVFYEGFISTYIGDNVQMCCGRF